MSADIKVSQKHTTEHTTPRLSVARSGALMAVGTTISRVLGFFKSVLIAYALGTLGPLSSIFDASNNLPNLLYIMLAGGIFNVVLVPQIIKASKLPDRGADYLSRLLTLGVLVLFTLTALLTVAAGPLMTALTTFRGEQLLLASHFAVWLLPQIFFYGLYALLGQILNAHDRFGSYMWAPVLNNLIAIGGVAAFLVLWGSNQQHPHEVGNWLEQQTVVLAGTTTLGVVLQALILLFPVARLQLRLRPTFGWRGMGLGQTGKIAGWALGTMIVGQLSYLFITWVGSAATSGADAQNTVGIFVFNRASDIYILPHSIVVLSIATILFNRMTRAADRNDRAELRDAVSKLVRTVGVVTLFFAAVLFVLSGQIGMFLSGGNTESSLSVGLAIAILAFSSPFLSLNFIFNRVFYAMEDARTPFILQSILVCYGITAAMIAMLIAPRTQLVYVLVVTVSIGNVLAPFLSGITLIRRLGNFGIFRIVRAHVQFFVAALGAAALGFATLIALGGRNFFQGFAWSSPWAALTTIVVVCIIMLFTYILNLRFMRVQEFHELFAPLRTRLSSRLRTTSEVDGANAQGPSATPQSFPSQTLGKEIPLTESIDVGFTLGSRYEVLRRILVSVEGDLVLDGRDKILNRPVSILVASTINTAQLTQNSRMVATGERTAPFQILDMGSNDGLTYLITSTTAAAELLDLLVAKQFIEPHFTDTLGIEVFGTARPPAPASSPYEYIYDDSPPLTSLTPIQQVFPSPAQDSSSDETEKSLSEDYNGGTDAREPTPTPTQGKNFFPTSQQTSASDQDHSPDADATTESAKPVDPADSEKFSPDDPMPEVALNTAIPTTTFSAQRSISIPAPAAAEPEFDDDEENTPRSGRWVLLVFLVLLLGTSLIFALSYFTNSFNSTPSADSSPKVSGGSNPTASASSSQTAPTVVPTPIGITRIIGGGSPSLSGDNDAVLPNLLNKNAGVVWSSLQFSSSNFGRLAQSMGFVIELAEPAKVQSVQIRQLGGIGGSFEVLANDQPNLLQALSVGSGSFTGPKLTVALNQDKPMKYLILNFTELPRLQSTTLPNLPFGLRISEITIQ